MIEHDGFVVWMTGLPGSGKTTVALALEAEFKARGMRVERLDGDTIRQGLSSDLGFSKADREQHIARVRFVAKLLSRNNVAVLASFISPYIAMREQVRDEVTNYIEVFVDAPLEVCIQRDPKGLYAKALAGEIDAFTGVSAPYEVPTMPDVHIRTHQETVGESALQVLDYLELNAHIPGAQAYAGD